jgi:hypothetical protein
MAKNTLKVSRKALNYRSNYICQFLDFGGMELIEMFQWRLIKDEVQICTAQTATVRQAAQRTPLISRVNR